MPEFLPGLELNRRFYEEVVRPLLERHFPSLPYCAALLGPGSDVLGFDTAMSMDHDWGPRLQLFLNEQEVPLKPQIDAMLRQELPHVFLGFPVDMLREGGEQNNASMHLTTEGPVHHRVILLTLRYFMNYLLAYDVAQPLTPGDWLTFPSQALLELTTGAVYHDDTGALTKIRAQFAWYPHDLWLYLLACGWQRIGQEEHLMPRAGFVGDELGSTLIAGRLVRDIMGLCFLMERRYAPYAKWFGSAFQRLACAESLLPLLRRVQQSATWQERAAALAEAYSLLAHMHNALGLTAPLPTTPSSFYDRPFPVIHGEIFTQALLARISDPEVQCLTKRKLIGNIDQWSDSTDLRATVFRSIVRQLYEGNL